MDEYTIDYFLLLCAFFIMVLILRYINKKLQNSDRHILKLEEYLPTEEIQTLKQVFYLAMITLFIIDIFYQIASYGNELIYFSILDIVLSLIVLVYIKVDNIKKIVLAIGILPIFSSSYLIYNQFDILEIILCLIHIAALFYMSIYFYQKFKKYTKSQELSYTILLLFGIIFFSFIFTSFVEKVTLLDALVMVSNAFTSNGYAILGGTILGKINAIFLVWSGYVLSGAGTATLTVALMVKYYNKRFDKIEKMIQELKEEK